MMMESFLRMMARVPLPKMPSEENLISALATVTMKKKRRKKRKKSILTTFN